MSLAPTTTDAVAFLIASGEAEEALIRRGPETSLRGPRLDSDAEEGDVSWLSTRAFADDPNRLSQFQGSFLLVPIEVDPAPVPAEATVLPVAEPRLAFSLLVHHFFDDLTDPGWPDPGSNGSASAQIGHDVHLAPGVVLGAGVSLGDRVRVGPNTCLAHCTVEADVEIGANCTIGGTGFGYTRASDGRLIRFPHVGRVLIEREVHIGANTCIDRGALGTTVIGAGSKVDNLVHIAHNVQIGQHCLVIAHAMVAGSVAVGDAAWIAPSAAIRNRLTVGAEATVGMGAVVVRDVPPGSTVVGNPARPLS